MDIKNNNNKIKQKSSDTELSSFVEKLANIVSKQNLTEIEIESDGNYIKISKQLNVTNSVVTSQPINNIAPQPVVSNATENNHTETKATDLVNNPNVLLAPMVGTIYKKASPEDGDFKVVGDIVKKGDTVFLIEAMKVFSPIKAHKDGKVKEIFVDSGKPVEYNQPLMLIE